MLGTQSLTAIAAIGTRAAKSHLDRPPEERGIRVPLGEDPGVSATGCPGATLRGILSRIDFDHLFRESSLRRVDHSRASGSGAQRRDLAALIVFITAEHSARHDFFEGDRSPPTGRGARRDAGAPGLRDSR